MTAEATAEVAADRVRTISVRGIQVRVSERPASGRLVDEPPLLLCNGIGVSLEALQPLVDHLDPARGIVRFDVPGVGGSPATTVPVPDRRTVVVGDGADGQAGAPPVRRPRAVLGWRPGPAARRAVAPPGTPPRAGRHRHGRPDGAGQSARARPDVHAAAPPRPGVRRAHRRRDLRRQHAYPPRAWRRPAARHHEIGTEARLLLPAGRDGRMEQPAVPPPDHPADAGDGR